MLFIQRILDRLVANRVGVLLAVVIFLVLIIFIGDTVNGLKIEEQRKSGLEHQNVIIKNEELILRHQQAILASHQEILDRLRRIETHRDASPCAPTTKLP